MSIQRGSTPVHTFHTPVDLSDVDVIYITYSQAGKTVVEKDKSACEFLDEAIKVRLTQEDTLAFNPDYKVKIQIRARYHSGSAIVSNIMVVSANEILKDGVI